jgi:hypothetical protein
VKHFLQTLVEAAQQKNLAFLVVGGNAVILLGVPRFTRDIDLLITDKDRDAWRQLVENLGYYLYHRAHAFDQFESIDKKELNKPGIDFMLVDEPVWQKLNEASRRVELSPGLLIPVPDPLHLIAMKLQASQSPHRKRDAQDLSDVAQLMKLFKMELNQPLIRDTLIKHGGESVLSRLEKML